MEFGSQIKTRRQELGLSQGQVANHLYVSRKSVSHWENGNTFPDIATLIKLSNYYQISLDPLIKEDTNMEENLKKREFKRVSGLPLYLSMALSLITFFVGMAGIGHMLSFFTTILVMIILALANIVSLYPISNLREKYYLTNKLERIFGKPWVFSILGILIFFLGIFLDLNVNEILGYCVTGFGIGSIIGGFLGIWERKRIHQRK